MGIDVRGRGVGRRAPWRRRRTLRWAVAGVLVLAAPLAGRAGATPTHAIVSAARDLPAGHVLAAGDVTLVEVPRAVVPDGAAQEVSAVDGLRLGSALRRGEVLTDVRLDPRTGPARAELRVVPVPLADQGAAASLRAGDVVDLVAPAAEDRGAPAPGVAAPPLAVTPPPAVTTTSMPPAAEPIVRDAEVVEVVQPRTGGPRSVLVAVPTLDAATLAATAATTALVVLVHR